MFSKLTQNIGESIKVLAKIFYYFYMGLAVIALAISWLAGIIAGISDEFLWGLAIFGMFIGGAIILAIYAIVSTMIIYGFGELISTNKKMYDKTVETNDNASCTIPASSLITTKAKLEKVEEKKEKVDIRKVIEEKQIPNENQIKCPHCGKIQNKENKRCLFCSKMIDEQ